MHGLTERPLSLTLPETALSRSREGAEYFDEMICARTRAQIWNGGEGVAQGGSFLRTFVPAAKSRAPASLSATLAPTNYLPWHCTARARFPAHRER